MERFNPLDPTVLADPYPAYADYRAQEPVHWGMPGDEAAPSTWYLFRYDEAAPALKDPRFGREVGHVKPQPPVASEFQPLNDMAAHWMILRDPPAHTRLRGLVNKAFTPRVAEHMRPRIALHADRLIDAVIASGRMDVIADFARMLPTMIIAEAIGVPSEDCALFLPWSVALAATLEFKPTNDMRRRGTEAMAELCRYLRVLMAQRRDDPRDDLLTALLHAEDEHGALSEDEILGTITLLLTAGNDPTQHLIGNAMLALLRHPAELTWLRTHREAIESATDELLRYDSSVQATFRYALEDIEIGGQHFAAGDHVAILFGSALRDPAYCERPDVLDLTRKNNALPYGFGPHFCLGMPLARAIGQVAVERLITRLPDMALGPQVIAWEERVAVRGVKSLPVTFDLRFS